MRWPAEIRRPLLALGLLAALCAAAVGFAAAPPAGDAGEEAGRRANRSLVVALGLTDLALWSEATYSRHPSQADRFAAWADHPMALEHFPSGSIVPPPPAAPRAIRTSGGQR